MDDIVKQGMVKWPNVPAVYGWLGLDRRGQWLLKGERISNAIITDFIGRNYEHDNQGRWFFQNGPQRVFVTLDYTPFVYRLAWDPAPGAAPQMETHTARTVTRLDGAWIDESGIVLVASEHGVGLVDDRDLERLLTCFTDEDGRPLAEEALDVAMERLQAGGRGGLTFSYRGNKVPVSAITSDAVPARFGFVQRPAQPAGEEACS